ncbi:MAG: TIGR02147 family protein [Deltaproteobacteria bacterium]|nr:TIGR02147 family protein [Deltaproteobacteria bacterium]
MQDNPVGHINPYRTWLANQLEKRRNRNPAFSLRSFARCIGTSPSTLSQVVAGKRPLSRKLIPKLLQGLDLSPQERMEFWDALSENFSEIDSKQNLKQVEHYPELTLDKFAIVSDWRSVAVLHVLELARAKWDCAWISKRLGLTRKEVRETLKRLEAAGLIERTGKSFRIMPSFYAVSEKSGNRAIQNFHWGMLGLVRRLIYEVPARYRDISAITMAVAPANLPRARKMILAFRRRLCRLLEAGEKTEVYTLSVQLFPLTKMRGGKQ